MKKESLLGDRGVLLAGMLGLGTALFVACGGGADAGADADDSTAGTSASAAGATTSGDGAAGAATVAAGCDSDPATAENTAAVVAAANTLLDALTAEQKTAIMYEATLANAEQWSNFPTTFVQRNGVTIGDMSEDAQAAAVALAEVAAGATGGTLLDELREADEFLVSDGKASSTDYGRGLYYFSIHGTPATDAAWMLQIAGHHLAYNFTYGGKCTSATPLFDGVEPTTWTDSEGKDHAPLEAQRASVVELLTSISELSDAKLSGTFSDLVNGPAGGGPGGGGGDTKFPEQLSYPTGTTGRGVNVSSLSTAQVALVKTAIESWVKNVAEPVSTSLLAEYESEEALADTYVGYAGSADLTTQTSYFRVDGPRVWIELTVQGGIVYHDRVHYHTIWRDKVADYGAEYGAP